MCENLNMYKIEVGWKKHNSWIAREMVVLEVMEENLSGEYDLILSSRKFEDEEFLGLLKYLVPQEILNECEYRLNHYGRNKEEQFECENDIDYYNNEMNRC